MFLALRELAFARGRFALMGLVLALMAVLTVLLSGLAVGLVDDGIAGLRQLPATHLAFQPGSEATFSRSIVDGDTWRTLDAVDGVEATPLGSNFFNGRTSTGTAVDLVVWGIDPDGFLAPTVDEGEGLAHGDTGVVIARQLADEGVGVGDEITLSGIDEIAIRVVGIADIGTYGHVPVVMAPLEVWRRVTFGPESVGRDVANVVALRGRIDPPALEAVADVEILTRQQAYAGSPGYSAETATMTLIRAFLYLIGALVVGAFFSVWTVQRTAEIGVLRAMGASTAYLIRDALAQALVLLVTSTGVGALVGLLLGLAVASTDIPFSLRPGPAVGALVLLIVLGLVGAAATLRRIARVDPLIAVGARR